MDTSRKSSSGYIVALLTVVVLLGACVSGAKAVLSVRNNLKVGNVTLSDLPGCCSSCVPARGHYCPAVCKVCAEVVVATGKLVTLNPRVSPYPLEYITIQVKDKVYSVPQSGKLTAKATLVLGPGTDCGPEKTGVEASIVEGTAVVSICLTLA